MPGVPTGEVLSEWLNSGRDPEEISAEALKKLKAAVSKIKAVSHLENWWKKHQAEAARLTPEDKERLVTHCGNRKEKLIEDK